VAANIVSAFTLGTCAGITACEQLTIGSSFLADLNAGDDSVGNVAYTNIATVMDELVQPYTNSSSTPPTATSPTRRCSRSASSGSSGTWG
jgi:hypothetical protein